MDIYSSAKILALKATIKNDSNHEMRKIMRWYSKNLHTPLDKVYELPLDFVLQAYYEDRFDDMDREEIRRNMIAVTESEEDRKKREKDEELFVDEEQIADDDFLKMIAEEEAAKSKIKPAGVTPNTPAVSLPKKIEWSPNMEMPETELPSAEYKLPTTEQLFNLSEDEDSLAGLSRPADWSLLGKPKKQS